MGQCVMKRKRKLKIINPDRVVEDIVDPSGFTPENNPYKYYKYDEITDPYDYRRYYEYDKGIYQRKCHRCLVRAKIGSGNCVNNGPYFQCMEEYLKKRKIKKTVQVSLEDVIL